MVSARFRSWNPASLTRGEKIYELVCHSCHGDPNLRGSLPDALPFHAGQFQHGGDPFRMYQTITRGWRMMPPQVQLVPQEKSTAVARPTTTSASTAIISHTREVANWISPKRE